ncbi:MAG: AbrB/MazE/SpoVT family DNA-binding domain-containing protein [Verrucomicrobiaceae bacterium]|jgi:putative addiction module antidote|nr:AbrB/MazE/SpoVT family DNA-binding domain-containing protein [Verrucomicrobiaceae bacterium]
MIHELKLRKIGNSVGVVLPKEVLTVLKAQEGDSVQVTEAADGSIRLNMAKPEVSKQMKIAQDIMERYRNTLRELAK